ncbi:MAG TPA: hypothetical protein VMV42_00655 [archaeon]|nr:hypothetical protein [archaeon]
MLTMRALLLLLVFAVGVAWSASPEIEKRKGRNEHANAEQKGTEKAPIFISGEVTTRKDKKEANEDAKERVLKADMDKKLVKYTGFLAAFTFLLFCFTAALWWATYRLSRDARTTSERQAAEMERSLSLAEKQMALVGMQVDNSIKQTAISREDFIATHRPRLAVRRLSINTVKGIGTPDILKVEFVVANIGATKAKIIEMSTRIWFPESSENLPAVPPYAESTFPGITLESGESGPLTHNDTAEMLARFQFQVGATQMHRAAEKARLLRSKNTAENEPAFLFIGYIQYEDALGRKRRTAYCRFYNFVTQRFDPIPHPDYEYQD